MGLTSSMYPSDSAVLVVELPNVVRPTSPVSWQGAGALLCRSYISHQVQRQMAMARNIYIEVNKLESINPALRSVLP
jgi:hypothetical protein